MVAWIWHNEPRVADSITRESMWHGTLQVEEYVSHMVSCKSSGAAHSIGVEERGHVEHENWTSLEAYK